MYCSSYKVRVKKEYTAGCQLESYCAVMMVKVMADGSSQRKERYYLWPVQYGTLYYLSGAATRDLPVSVSLFRRYYNNLVCVSPFLLVCVESFQQELQVFEKRSGNAFYIVPRNNK